MFPQFMCKQGLGPSLVLFLLLVILTNKSQQSWLSSSSYQLVLKLEVPMLEVGTVSSGDQTSQPVYLHSLSCLMQLICPDQLSPNPDSSTNLIQLAFNPQEKNNPWIINQRCGVSSPDLSEALTGPRGLRWREDQGGSTPSPAGANQNKSRSERPSMCSSHLRPLKENTSLIPIYFLKDRQIRDGFLSPP